MCGRTIYFPALVHYAPRLPGPPDGLTYLLTLCLFELAHLHPPVDRLRDCAMPHMQELARGTSQSNHLCVHHDARLVVIARAESPEPMSYSVRQGWRRA